MTKLSLKLTMVILSLALIISYANADTVIFEAEDAVASGVTVINNANCSSGKCVTDMKESGDFILFNTNLLAGGQFKITYSLNAASAQKLSVYMNSIDIEAVWLQPTESDNQFVNTQYIKLPLGGKIKLQIDPDDYETNQPENASISIDKITVQNAYCLPEKENILNGLKPEKPRLFLDSGRLEQLKADISNTDDYQMMSKLYNQVVTDASQALSIPVPDTLERQSFRENIPLLSYVWLLTDDQQYALKAKQWLLSACQMSDWQPEFVLDTADMTFSVAVGYDWLYDFLTQSERTVVEQALKTKGLDVASSSYSQGKWWLENPQTNYNCRCSSAAIIAALAVGNVYPDISAELLSSAIPALSGAVNALNKDGAWNEGFSYWHSSVVMPIVQACAALNFSVGEDWGLSEIEGLRQTGYFPIYLTGPTDLYVNYSDSIQRLRWASAAMFWLANTFQNPSFTTDEHSVLSREFAANSSHISPFHLIWFEPMPSQTPQLPADMFFRGETQVISFRSQFSDEDQLFVSVKAGNNIYNHRHLDLGTFELDALGHRWAWDLGYGNASELSGYNDYSEQSPRWNYYRISSLGHNVPLINDSNQSIKASADVIKFDINASNPYAVIDLTAAYRQTQQMRRGIKILTNSAQQRRAVLIQDQWNLASQNDLAWSMTTSASVSNMGDTAVLTMDSDRLKARILSPQQAVFTVESAEQPPPQYSNEGFNRLMVRLENIEDKAEIAVLLSPIWHDNQFITSTKFIPLEQWALDEQYDYVKEDFDGLNEDVVLHNMRDNGQIDNEVQRTAVTSAGLKWSAYQASNQNRPIKISADKAMLTLDPRCRMPYIWGYFNGEAVDLSKGSIAFDLSYDSVNFYISPGALKILILEQGQWYAADSEIEIPKNFTGELKQPLYGFVWRKVAAEVNEDMLLMQNDQTAEGVEMQIEAINAVPQPSLTSVGGVGFWCQPNRDLAPADYPTFNIGSICCRQCDIKQDINNDCCVDMTDFSLLASQWLEGDGEKTLCFPLEADIDNDRIILTNDLILLLDKWLTK